MIDADGNWLAKEDFFVDDRGESLEYTETWKPKYWSIIAVVIPETPAPITATFVFIQKWFQKKSFIKVIIFDKSVVVNIRVTPINENAC